MTDSVGKLGMRKRPVNENSYTTPPPVNFSYIMPVFRRLVKELRAGQGALEARELERRQHLFHGEGEGYHYDHRRKVYLFLKVLLLEGSCQYKRREPHDLNGLWPWRPLKLRY